MHTVANVDNESAEPVKVNRWAIGLLITIAALIGLAPVTFFLGRPQLLLYILGVVVLIVGQSLLFGKFQTAATYAPNINEFLFAELDELAMWALLGIVWLVAYVLFFWGSRLVQFLLVLAGWHVQLNADAIAFYPTVVLAGLIIILFAIGDIEPRIDELYPKTAGTRSVYHEGAAHGRAQLLRLEGTFLLIFALIGLVLWFLTKQFFSIWFYINLQVYVFCVGILLPNKTATVPSSGMSNAAQAISKLLKAVGYQVISDPRTGKSDTDPLLTHLDLFVHNDKRALAIDIKTVQQSDNAVEWTVGSSVRMAALALDDEAQELGIKSGRVEPIIVLVGREPTNSLRAFCNEMAVQLITISDKAVIDNILAINDQTDLEGMASKYLAGIANASNDTAAPDSETDELEGRL